MSRKRVFVHAFFFGGWEDCVLTIVTSAPNNERGGGQVFYTKFSSTYADLSSVLIYQETGQFLQWTREHGKIPRPD